MATTQNTFTGNGSNLGPFSFTFKWLEPTDIKVSVGGVLKTAGTHYNLQNLSYTTKTGGEVLFTSGNTPASGSAIRVFRDTDDSALSATFNSGSAIRAQDLNDNFTQNLYVTQEVNNNSVNIDGSNPMVGDLDMGGYQINNLAEPTVDDDAATKYYIDQRYGSTTIPAHTRWRKTATAGQTTFSGTGDYGGSLTYSALREQVYLNGALQQRSADYTADNGTSIVFSVPLTAGDVVDVVCVNNTNTSGISNAANISYSGQFSGQTVRTVAAKLADVVSVKDFGAVGDGVADDTAAIQAAIAASYGKTVRIPKGQYKLSASLTITAGIAIEGEGWDSVLVVDAAATRFIPILSQNNSTGVVGLSISNLAINGSGKGQLDAGLIQLNNVVGFSLDHLRVFNGGTPNEANPSGVNGISVSAGSLGGIASEGSITSCLVEQTTKGGINWTTEAVNGFIAGNIVRNCTGNGLTPGIQVNGGYNVKVIGNSVYGCQGAGIIIGTSGGTGTERSPRYAIFADNHSYNNGLSGFEWVNGTSVYFGRVIIANNHSYSNGQSGEGSGFLIQNDANAIVTGNYAYLNRSHGFSLSGGTYSADISLLNNKAENNNQANLSTGSGFYVAGTGFTRLRLIGNESLDTQGSPTQRYGLILDGAPVVNDLYIRDFIHSGSVNKPGISISSSSSVSKYDVELLFDRQTTTGATTNTAILPLPDLAAARYSAEVVAKSSTSADRAFYNKTALFFRNGGNATAQGSTAVSAEIESNAAWDASLLSVGNVIYTQLLGAAATTVDWAVKVKLQSL